MKPKTWFCQIIQYIRIYWKRISWKNVIKEAASVSLSGILNEGKGENPVLIEYTGGTTGFPKGVVLTNNNVNSVGEQEGI